MQKKRTPYNRKAVLSMIGNKDYVSAKKLLENILNEDKNNSEAWFFLGAIYGQQEHFEKAIQCSKKSILGNFNAEGAYFNMGIAQRSLGRTSEAMDSFRQAIKINPGNQAAVGQFKQAWHDLSRAQSITINIKGNIAICTPSTPELLTPYVLLEQEDWFENEIAFIRKLIQPGNIAIDIGANYGTYTFTMAKHCKPDGFVYAFEPVQSTVSYLEESIRVNGFGNVKVIPKAISNFEGTSRIFLTDNSEMNSLTRDVLHNNSEEIHVTTLDNLTALIKGREITFIKIDAEGEECRVIEGGDQFFKKQSPLVMMEIKHGQHTNIDLLDDLKALGYSPYRLVPGLCILTEFTENDSADSIQLNIFCCKNNRAEQLRKQGLLAGNCSNMSDEMPARNNYWSEFARQHPYTEAFCHDQESSETSDNTDYHLALCCYAQSQSESESIDTRYRALHQSLEIAKRAIATKATLPRQLTITRLFLELGYQGQAVSTLKNVMRHINKNSDYHLDEPFLPPRKRFDRLPVGKVPNDWLICCIFECMELISKFTSYSSGIDDLPRLENILRTGYAGIEIERRYQLIRVRHGLKVSSKKSSVLSQGVCLNNVFWKQQLPD